LIIVFLFAPLLASVAISFLNWDGISPPTDAGMSNYRELLHDTFFFHSMALTGLFVAATVPLTMVLALALALLLENVVYAKPWFRVALFVPYAMSSVIVALIWRWFFDGAYGFLNYLLHFVGIQGPDWLNNPHFALPAVISVFIWQQVGFNVVLFIVALNEVPSEIKAAARVDGGGPWVEFRYVTLPMISPITFFILLNTAFLAFQSFDLAYVMTDGGPGTSTTFMMQFIYQSAFQSFRLGYAAAAAVVYILAIGAVTAAIWAMRRHFVFAEEN
jgi:ABC-type sugar transport system permease subunit